MTLRSGAFTYLNLTFLFPRFIIGSSPSSTLAWEQIRWRSRALRSEERDISRFERVTRITRGRCTARTMHGWDAIADAKSTYRLYTSDERARFEEPAAGNIRDIKVELPSCPHALATARFYLFEIVQLHRRIVAKTRKSFRRNSQLCLARAVEYLSAWHITDIKLQQWLIHKNTKHKKVYEAY